MARDLEDLYDVYNKRYFKNRLPKIEVRWARTEPGHSAEFCTGEDGTHWINVHPVFKRLGLWNYIGLLLIHEQIHVKYRKQKGNEHGRLFEREKKRLAADGALKHLW